MQSIRGKSIILQQIVEFIPGHLVKKLAQKHGVDKKARSFSPFSHVVSMIYAHLSHSLSLNDISDSLRNHNKALLTVRGAVPPSRNGLSNANKCRSGNMAEELFWGVFDSLKNRFSSFGKTSCINGTLKKFKRTINVVDSTTIQLVANCMSWAKHRRRKAAVKCHMRLDLHSFLPKFAIVDTAKHSDPVKAYELCSGIKDGEIVIFDKAYVDTNHLSSLDERGVFWITRAKENMTYDVVGKSKTPKAENIIKDEIVVFSNKATYEQYPKGLRRIEAMVEVDKKMTLMVFITNNFIWSASSVCELYKARWAIEVFFKQLKQTLQLVDFFGNNENAIKWQIWTALLVYVLLRLISSINKWEHSFSRLFTLLRSVLWDRFILDGLIKSCGTAGAMKRTRTNLEQAYLPGLSWKKAMG